MSPAWSGYYADISYFTRDGSARAGSDYTFQSGYVEFNQNDTSKTITIPIIDDILGEGNETFNVLLSHPVGPPPPVSFSNATLLGSPTNALVTIVDDESQAIPNTSGEFNFSASIYIVTENETFAGPICLNDVNDNPAVVLAPDHSAYGALITVVRTNGARGRVMVDFATVAGGTAVPGLDFISTNGTLIFDDYQMSTNFLVTISNGSFFFNFNTNVAFTFFNVELSNPRPDPLEDPFDIKPVLGLGSQATVDIIDVNIGFFGAPAFNGSWIAASVYSLQPGGRFASPLL
jgi:hypothetical protein